MDYQETEVQTLVNLGLTSIQARIYLNIAKSGASSVAVIARQSKVNRPNVYRTVTKLHDLGIVEKIADTPATLFKAVSADQTLKCLLQRKTEQHDSLTNEKAVVFQPKEEKQYITADIKFVLIPKEDIIKRVIQAFNQTQSSVDFIVSWKRLSTGDRYKCYSEIAKNAKVQCRCILEQPQKYEDIELIKKIKPKTCRIKFVKSQPSAVLGIFEKKEIIVVENAQSNLKNSSALWTNNESMVTIAQNYFENLWHNATDEPF